jgi:tricorn protease-like protein
VTLIEVLISIIIISLVVGSATTGLIVLTRTTANANGVVLFERGGNSWLRRGYHGPVARDVWCFTPGKPPEQAFQRLTSWMGNDGQGQWLGNDAYLFFSDRDGAVNLYRKALKDAIESGGTQLTAFPDDVTAFDVSADGNTVFLTRGSQLYRLDLTKPDAKPQALVINASADEPDPVEMRKVDKDITEAQASPDGKAMAFVAYGDVFVRSMDEKAPAVRVTSAPWRKSVRWITSAMAAPMMIDATEVNRPMVSVVSIAPTTPGEASPA